MAHPNTQVSSYPYPSLQGYPTQPYGIARPSFNPYQAYGGAVQPYYADSAQISRAWPRTVAQTGPAAEQEVQRLRNHIQTLESQLRKLQKKLSRTTVQNNDVPVQDDNLVKQDKDVQESNGSPRKTPVIVELNSTNGETMRRSSSKKHRHRSSSRLSSKHDHKGQGDIGHVPSSIVSTHKTNVSENSNDTRDQ
jgi:uncharacterized membrane protein (UPF0182 family)